MSEKMQEKGNWLVTIVILFNIVVSSILCYFAFFNHSYPYPKETIATLKKMMTETVDISERNIHYPTTLPEDIVFTISSDSSSNTIIDFTKKNEDTIAPDLHHTLTLSSDFTVMENRKSFPTAKEYEQKMLSIKIINSIALGILLSSLIDFLLILLIFSIRKHQMKQKGGT